MQNLGAGKRRFKTQGKWKRNGLRTNTVPSQESQALGSFEKKL